MLQSRILAACILRLNFNDLLPELKKRTLSPRFTCKCTTSVNVTGIMWVMFFNIDITHVIHSLRTRCSELEAAWNRADYCRSRQSSGTCSINHQHLTSSSFCYWCQEYWHLHRLYMLSLYQIVEYNLFCICYRHPHGRILAECKLKIVGWKYRNLVIPVSKYTVRFIHHFTNLIKCMNKIKWNKMNNVNPPLYRFII